MTLTEALSRLAAAPPKLFTRERRALVESLQKAGQANVARAIRARRAPTVAVWVANRLATRYRKALDGLVSAADRLKAAQLGRAGVGGLTQAMAAYRASLDRFLDHGRTIVKEAGAANAEQVLSRVERTVTAALVDETARAALRRGELESELAAPGFDAFGGARPVRTRRPAKRTPTSSPDRAAPPPRSESRQSRREGREQERRQRLEPLEAELARAQQELAAAEARVPATKARLTELRQEAHKVRRDLQEHLRASSRRTPSQSRSVILAMSFATTFNQLLGPRGGPW